VPSSSSSSRSSVASEHVGNHIMCHLIIKLNIDSDTAQQCDVATATGAKSSTTIPPLGINSFAFVCVCTPTGFECSAQLPPLAQPHIHPYPSISMGTLRIHMLPHRTSSHPVPSHSIASHRVSHHIISSHIIPWHRIASHLISSAVCESLRPALPARCLEME